MILSEIIEKLQFHFQRLADKYPHNSDVGAIGACVLVELKNLLPAQQVVKGTAQVEETLPNTQIREQLYKLLPLFLIQNCQYNDAERKMVKWLVESLQPVNTEFEKYNKEHPMHGLPNQNKPPEERPINN